MAESDAGAPLDVIARSLRRERTRAGLSLSEAAKRAGIAKSTLSQLEAGTGNPSIETLWALGVALDVPFSRLVDPPRSAVQVIRAGEGSGVASEQAHFIGKLLSSGPANTPRDIYIITLEPGAPRHAEPHIAGTVEHLTVAAGQMRAGPRDGAIELAAGDYACFPGDVPHLYEALEPHTWAVLVMQHG